MCEMKLEPRVNVHGNFFFSWKNDLTINLSVAIYIHVF